MSIYTFGKYNKIVDYVRKIVYVCMNSTIVMFMFAAEHTVASMYRTDSE